jgi:AcrR family transcriptional regulator
MDEGDRREALLRAAVTVFHREGYQGATVRQITEAAGCATGTFYRYFPSKDDCFLALIDRLYRRVLETVVAARKTATVATDKLQQVRVTLADLIVQDLREAGLEPWPAACAARALTGAFGEVLVWQVASGTDEQTFRRALGEVRQLFWRGVGFAPPVSPEAGGH